jgi:hypothetical protein
MLERRLLFLAACGATTTVAIAAPVACYVTINDINQPSSFSEVIESPCFSTIYTTVVQGTSLFPFTLRSFPRNAAYLVEASIEDDPGNSFQDNLFFTSGFVFGYIAGDYNSGTKGPVNLTTSRTAPLTLRPVSPERPGAPTWVAAMALAPSLWPAGSSSPPTPTLSNIDVRPFGGVVMASVPAVLSASPTEDDFQTAYKALEEAVGFAPGGEWVINTTSPLTPSFNFYFTDSYNGTSWLIEASAEVYRVPQAEL